MIEDFNAAQWISRSVSHSKALYFRADTAETWLNMFI